MTTLRQHCDRIKLMLDNSGNSLLINLTEQSKMMLGSTKFIPGNSLLLAQNESESMGMKLVTNWP